MKKLTFIALSMMVTASSVLAGGLVTNVNQSSAWARTLSRDASTGIDAVYYNPAGLAWQDSAWEVSGNVSLIMPGSKYTRATGTEVLYPGDPVAETADAVLVADRSRGPSISARGGL